LKFSFAFFIKSKYLLYIMKIKTVLYEFFSFMNRSFSVLNLCLGIGIVGAPGLALAQFQEEQVRPMSVVPTDEPTLAPKPLSRSEDDRQRSLVPTKSTQEKTTQPVSIPSTPDLQPHLSPRYGSTGYNPTP
jgi:hypothetical protein